jgi:hypothetical protein
MFTIWKKVSDESWEYVEDCSEESAVYPRLEQLRLDGNEYRAEKRDGGFSSVLGV